MGFYRRWIYLRWRWQQWRNPYPQTGLYWHVHHNLLCEWCYDYKVRALFIINCKSLGELKLRLRLLQPVKGELKVEVVDKLIASKTSTWEVHSVNKRFREVIVPLHKEECPDCPWDGFIIC